MNGFVYRWLHLPTEKYYIGSHQGDTRDGYICSSDIIVKSIQADNEDWRRDILAMGDIEEMRDIELKILKELFQDPMCLNQGHSANAPVVLKAAIKPKERTVFSTEVKYLLQILGE